MPGPKTTSIRLPQEAQDLLARLRDHIERTSVSGRPSESRVFILGLELLAEDLGVELREEK